MKKICFVLLLIFLLPSQVLAASYGNMYYVSFLDQYRVDYSYNTADVRYDLVFNATDGKIYTADYNFPPTGIHYLTCNGTYNMNFYNSSGSVVHTLGPMVTTAIVNPTCNSYADGVSGKNDLNAKQNGNLINWNSLPNADKYEVWKDGSKLGQTTGTSYSPTSDGGYSIVARDSKGNVVGQSDLTYKATTSGGDGGTTNPSDPNYGDFDPNCATCKQLWELLQCPDWYKYMGQLTQAIKNALPTLPEWRGIADQFVNAFADYWGPVPDAPTVQEIEGKIVPTLPPVDTQVPIVEPQLPSEFDKPTTFDITTGPEIPIVDDSQPIEIYEPDKYIHADTPGQMVFPGDSRNHSDGIKQPDTIQTPYTIPVPTVRNDNQTVPTEIPIPSISTGTIPKPNATSGVGPIPELR